MIKNIYVLSEEGEDFYPATGTDAVGHDQMESSLTKLINKYNLSSCWPTKGINGSSKYNLNLAITQLDSVLTDTQKVPGVRVGFINESGEYEEWEFFGKEFNFSNEGGWRKIDSAAILELMEKVFPVTVSLTMTNNTVSSNNNLAAAGTPTEFVFNWVVYRKGADVTTSATKYFNGTKLDSLSKQKTETVLETEHVTKTFEFSATYQGLSDSATKTVTVVHPCYYGTVSEGVTPDTTTVSGFSKTSLKNSKSFTWSGINMTYKRICYAYPKYHGALTSIKDGNNFEYLQSFNRTEITIDSVAYYVYTMIKPVTVSNYKQIFS